MPLRSHKLVIACLFRIPDILSVDEQAHGADVTLGKKSENPIGDALCTIGIVIESLRSRVKHFDTHTESIFLLPGAD